MSHFIDVNYYHNDIKFMSVYSRKRKQEYRKLKVFRDNADTIIENTFVFQVHEPPEIIDYGFECDFWIIERKGCYLLTVEKSKKNEICFQRLKRSDTLHGWLRQDIDKIDIAYHLKVVKTMGIPYKMKGRYTHKIEIDSFTV